MREAELKQMLTTRLKLREPEFHLQRVGNKLSGHVISDSFKGLRDSARLKKVWDALEAELGTQCTHQVGTLLLYTREEWDIDLPAGKRAKAG